MESKIHTIVYQPGKVGSVSLTKAISGAGALANHYHWISNSKGEFYSEKDEYVARVRAGEIIGENVITPVREPMARNLSAFFYNFRKYVKNWRAAKPESIQAQFMAKYDWAIPDRWFLELDDVYRFVPYVEPFDWERGYKIYEHLGNHFLILRVEDFERVMVRALKEFVGLDVEYKHENRTITRGGHNVVERYRLTKELPYPKEYVDKVYEMRYVRHFYSPGDIEMFKRRWTSEGYS